jgi:murein DD-endopeptidase MepM/ murein hydrolase activator NlpD
MMLTQLLRQMRESMLTGEDDGEPGPGLGSQALTDTIDAQLGQSLSRASGVGVADFIIRAFDRQEQAAGGPSGAVPRLPEAGALVPLDSPLPSPVVDQGGATPAPSVATAPAPPEGAVNSPFGWRNDPITGQQRFHSGTDVRMAYGQDVRAAAGGRVAFVGKQGGYGLTVVLDHGDGIETRYAHLSSAVVTVGDAVTSGLAIAHAGNSGRSTGTHLHFELLDHGQVVDPRQTAELLAGRITAGD